MRLFRDKLVRGALTRVRAFFRGREGGRSLLGMPPTGGVSSAFFESFRCGIVAVC